MLGRGADAGSGPSSRDFNPRSNKPAAHLSPDDRYIRTPWSSQCAFSLHRHSFCILIISYTYTAAPASILYVSLSNQLPFQFTNRVPSPPTPTTIPNIATMRLAPLSALVCLTAAVAASGSSNQNPPIVNGPFMVTAGKPATLTWKPTTPGPITLTLRSGASSVLKTDRVIACNYTPSRSISHCARLIHVF